MNLLRIFPVTLTFPAALLGVALTFQSTSQTVHAQDKTDTKPAETKPEKKEDLKFVRVSKEGKEPLALQTAVVKYKSDSKETEGVEVTLIGAVHIAEKSYYEDLNKLFTEYDVILYEMVSDPHQVPVPGERGSSPVSSVQVGMKDMLELTFQLDEVDYKAKNFVHADMSPEEFFDSMNKRKEGVFKMFLRSVGSGLAMQGSGKSNDLDVITAMLSEKRSSGLKRAMAEQFEMMDGQMAALQGEDGRSTLITERNAKAFKVLGEQIKTGKKKIGIFYGAGHFKDMHQRLIDDYRMQPVETKWMDAWDLKE